MIHIIDISTVEFEGDVIGRTADIIIGPDGGMNARRWSVGGLPVDGDLLPILQARFNELWMAAQNSEALDFRAWALATVRQIAAEKENEIDALIAGNPVRAMMLNTEIVQYQNDGRPANPSAAVYALADALATRRSATLRDTLEALRTRWLSVRSRIATIITELDRVEDAIKAAVDVGEIETILAGLNWG